MLTDALYINYLSFHLVFATHYMHSVGIPKYQQNHPKSDCILFVLHQTVHKVSMHTHANLDFSVCINTRQTHHRREKKSKQKCGREHMSNLQIFWLVKSYSSIVITVQCFFPNQNMQPARHCVSNLHCKNCDWTTASYATMQLATKIQHKDFNHQCKDFRAKEWHAFEL